MNRKKRRSLFSFLTEAENGSGQEPANTVAEVPPQQIIENPPLCKELENEIIEDNKVEVEVEVEDEDEVKVEVEDEGLSLLENKPFVKLVEECADMMNEFENYALRLETEEGRYMVQLILKRLQESLEHAGVERIENDNVFSVLRHTPVPVILVDDGAPLKETTIPGLAIENRVFRKAKVIIEK